MQKGILYILLSGVSFLVVNFFVKILGSGESQLLPVSGNKFPPHELVLFRSIISFSISAFLLKKRNLPILGYNRKWLLVRGVSGMIALTLFFYSIHNLPLAIASSVQYLAPIFTIILAVLIIKERMIPIQWLFIVIALFGALGIGLNNLLVDDKQFQISWFWLGIGIISAFFSGIAYVSILKLKKTDSPLNIVIYFPMLSLPVMGVWSIFSFVMPQGIEWIYVFVIGVFTQIAQIAMTRALVSGSASTITPFQYLGSVYAILVGYFLFDERISFYALCGIAFIIVGVIANVLVSHFKKSTVNV
jgi:drug/metabolite transporter (DMT)-like permease